MLTEALPVLRRDPVMAELIETHDPYDEPAWTEYERLCISIIKQQLSTASATAIRERVFDHLGAVAPETVLAAEIRYPGRGADTRTRESDVDVAVSYIVGDLTYASRGVFHDRSTTPSG